MRLRADRPSAAGQRNPVLSTCALPYFGFMTLLVFQQHSMLVAVAFLAAYNAVYTAPLVVIKVFTFTHDIGRPHLYIRR